MKTKNQLKDEKRLIIKLKFKLRLNSSKVNEQKKEKP